MIVVQFVIVSALTLYALYKFSEKPEWMVYALVFLNLTGIHNLLTAVSVSFYTIVAFMSMVVSAGLIVTTRKYRYSLGNVLILFMPYITILFIRIFIFKFPFQHQVHVSLITILLFFHLALSYIQTRKLFNSFLFVITLITIYISLDIYLNLIMGVASSSKDLGSDAFRAGSFARGINGSSGLLLILLPVNIYRYRTILKTTMLGKVFGLLPIGMSVLAIIFTVSRMGIIGLIFLLLYYISKTRQKILIGVPLAIVSVLVLFNLFTNPTINPYLDRYQTIGDLSRSDRLEIWAIYFEDVKEAPLLGSLGGSRRIEHVLSSEAGSMGAHNSYLALSRKFGIPIALYILSPFFYVILRKLTIHSKRHREFLMMITAMLVMDMAAYQVFGHNYTTMETYFPVLLWLVYLNIAKLEARTGTG